MATYLEVVRTQSPEQPAHRPHYYARYFGDPLSRLFWEYGELHVGVLPRHAPFFRKLVADGTTSELVSEGWLAEFGLTSSVHSLFRDALFQEVYRLVKTPRIVYWYEWSAEMLRAGALHMMQLMMALLDRNLTLRTPHPWNLVYDGTRFQYINPASVVTFDLEEFRKSWEMVLQFLVRPFLLASQGKFTVCRALLRDVQHGVPAGFAGDLGDVPEDLDKCGLHVQLSKAIAELRAIALPPNRTVWSGYESEATRCLLAKKREAVERFLAEHRPASVLDLAANGGAYARVAALHGCEAMATDVDESLVDQIYRRSQRADCAVTPAVLDFTHPAPAMGVDYRCFPAATERLRADMVLCFAVQGHFVFGRYRLDFDELARGVASFSNRVAVVEFVPVAQSGDARWREDAPWYSLEHLMQVLGGFFHSVELLPGSAEERRLVFCNGRRHTENP